MTMYHHAAAGVATLPSGRHSFPLDGGGGCAVGGEDEIDCRHHGGRGEARPGLGPHHRLDGSTDGSLNGDADLYHRLVVHPRPLAQRLDVSIELAQPCRETVTENGVTKDVHVIVKQVPFSIHVRLPPTPLKAPKRECRLSERRCGKVRSDGDDDYHDHHHHHHHQHHDAALSPTTAHGAMVTDLRGLEMEVRLRYDGEGGRAVPFVQRPPLDVIATRVADDGRSAVLTARVRALSSQHQNRLFVAHVRAFTPPPSPEASADQSPAATTSSLPPSGAPSPATGGLEPASTASVVLEALTEPIQVISKPRSSRKRVVRRKRTLGDMLLECTQRIERAQLAHAHAIGALSKRCRLVPRDNDATAAAQQQLHHSYEPHAPPPSQQQQQQQSQPQHHQQQAGDGNAFLMSPLEDPQLMMLMDLPAAFPHSFLPASFVPGPEQHHPQHHHHHQQLQHQHPFNAPYHHHQQHQHQYQYQADVKEELQAFFPAPTQRPLPPADDPLSPPLPGSAASPCSPACASSSSSAHHHQHPHQQHTQPQPQPQPQPQQQQLHHPRDPRLRTAHAAAGPVAASASSQGAPSVTPAPEEDPVEAAAGAFLRSYAALPSFDRSMAIRRVLRKYGTDRLQALGSLLALLASRTPPPKRAPNANEAASFQSCVCTSCSYEAELHNIDGFYKDFINLEFSFQ